VDAGDVGHGAGEAELTDAGGRLLEGAFTSLLLWDGETMWAVPDGERRARSR
jgi:hypothetical protein